MNGIQERLDYLSATKSMLKDSINKTGGSLSSDAPLSDFPGQVQYLIDTTIISQTELDTLTNSVITLNGEDAK